MKHDIVQIDDVETVIGNAITRLLKIGESPEAENIINMIQLMSMVSSDQKLKTRCEEAKCLILKHLKTS